MKIVNYLKSLMFIMLALTVANMGAANVDSQAAQAKAIQFMNSQAGTRFMASTANMKLTYAEKSVVKAGAHDYYVFNMEGGGFVIVSGDDRAEEILGYGEGYLDMNKIPANMKWWLGTYKEQIEFLMKNPKVQVQRMSDSSTMLKASAVPPLLTCEWDQESPYWNQCPSYGGSTCLTGCVATAMAQVMYYWKYPAQLPALPAYTTTTRHISVAALPGTTVDWNSMTDTYSNSSSSASKAAVATLMRYCGQSCKMDYDNANNGGSGAYDEDQLEGLKLFGYNSGATNIYRADYTDSQWTAMMLEDLQARRPILYGGDDGSAGHAFVVDGYDGSKYHINWGWSGEDNGYFAISSFMIDYYYDFRQNQDMQHQVYPEGSVLETYAPVLGNASNVGTTSFKATWTDQTPSENVTDYTLYVTEYDPNCETLLTETFAGITVSNDGTANIGNSLDSYCDNAGWTGSYVYQGAGGTVKVGASKNAGSLTTPALDMSSSGGTITVKFNARYYGSDNSSVVVSCGNVSETVALTGTAADYSVLLSGVNAAAGQKVTFACTGTKQRFYIDNIEITTGDSRSAFKASETGDASHRVITGITNKNYTVNNLNAGGSYKFYVEANYTDGFTKQSETKTVTLEGTPVATPELVVDPETLTMNANVGQTATATFEVLGADLTGNVTVTLTDANGVYTINPTTIAKAAAEAGATVTVTYAPTTAGTHNATITVASAGAESVTVTLRGDAVLQTNDPVMAAATNVTTTSFTATWTDATPAANVASYTLFVNKLTDLGDIILNEAFSGVTATNDGNARIEDSLDDYCDNAGWTGNYVYQAGGGGLKFGNSSNGGTLTTPALDLSNSGGVITVKLNGKNYGTDVTTLTVSCGNASQTVELTDAAEDHIVYLELDNTSAGQKVTISSNGSRQRYYLYSVQIFNGGMVKAASETGDENSRIIEGITAKTYTVENLTPGATYTFYVQANYNNNTHGVSNTEQVTLLDAPVVPTPELVVDPEALTMTAAVLETKTATIDVLAENLTGNVTVTLTDETGFFTVTPESISIADAEAGATITVTYAPTAAGEHTVTVTLSSEGAEDVTVDISATAAMETLEPEMQPANEEYVTTTSFRADWVDVTPEQYVKDYTLYVNKVIDDEGLILNETFGGVTAANDGTARIESALDDYCDNPGWTGSYVYLAGGGGLKFGNSSNGGSLTTPALDFTESGGAITVVVNAKNYGSDATTLTISCGNVSKTVELTEEAEEYTVCLEIEYVMPDQYVTISSTGSHQRFYLYNVKVYNWGYVKAVAETGDADSRVITGITDQYYVVENLTPGATYTYYVEANYIDDTKAASNVETVTLLEEQGHDFQLGDVNHDGSVSIADVTDLIDFLLGGSGNVCAICADVDGDSEISIADVTSLIDQLLSGN